MMNFPHMIPYNAPYYFVLLIAGLVADDFNFSH